MIFLTGITGTLGRELLEKLLTGTNFELALLVRSKNGSRTPLSTSALTATQRICSILQTFCSKEQLDNYLKRIRVIEGDIEKPSLGLNKKDMSFLLLNVREIVHCAASTLLDPDPDHANSINVNGTKEVLKLASQIQRSKKTISFTHISTAYVAGDTTETMSSDTLSLSQAFRNAYEASKASAEALVRAMSDVFQVQIFRPSIIVGNSQTGYIENFNVLYIPSRLVALGKLPQIPAIANTAFDIVPVDYVAQSIVDTLTGKRSRRLCTHLCTGYGRESSPREVLEQLLLSAEKFGYAALKDSSSIVEPIYIESDIPRQLLPFIPYMTSNPRFITPENPAPLFCNYASRIFDFCFSSAWGKSVVRLENGQVIAA